MLPSITAKMLARTVCPATRMRRASLLRMPKADLSKKAANLFRLAGLILYRS